MTDAVAEITRPDSPLVDRLRPSPNHGARRAGYETAKPDMLVLHYTGMPAGRGRSACERAVSWLTDTRSQVSAHYVIDEDGTILQLVPESRRAWHAGVSSWAGETDLNSASIGIEIVNPGYWWDMAAAPDRAAGEPVETHPGYTDFPAAQVDAVIALCRDILARNPVPADRVLAHSDIAPARKQDPGEKFPWERLAAAGVGLWTAPEPVGGGRFFTKGDEGQPIQALQAMFGVYGYGLSVTGVYDDATEQVVKAFQRHWRQTRVDGVADVSTITTLRRLMALRPVSSDARAEARA
ncbi:N-acetylmuramoyl-L-alanine amidase [Methyloraptor flagellatus]|uniref:N-acetylmuramoyl-L-alanine amidase n=1 Tax=Methyloraptor flagellatus TaxID=3162530 RepID=A0AAU7XCA1_9HYPH